MSRAHAAALAHVLLRAAHTLEYAHRLVDAHEELTGNPMLGVALRCYVRHAVPSASPELLDEAYEVLDHEARKASYAVQAAVRVLRDETRVVAALRGDELVGSGAVS